MKINPNSPKKCSMFQLNEMGNKNSLSKFKKRKTLIFQVFSSESEKIDFV
jgi:hypothetical protein